MGILLQQGIGDTIRVSLTPEPGGDRTREVQVAQELLQTMGFRSSCRWSRPARLRAHDLDRVPGTRADIEDDLRRNMPVWREKYPGVEALKVAVMGCIVNGPGESKHADIGISLPGTGETPAAPVFIDGKQGRDPARPGIADDFQKMVADYIDAGGIQPAHLRHRDVHQDDARLVRTEHLDRRAAIVGEAMAEAHAFENLREDQLVDLVVFRDEHVEAMVRCRGGLRGTAACAPAPVGSFRLRRRRRTATGRLSRAGGLHQFDEVLQQELRACGLVEMGPDARIERQPAAGGLIHRGQQQDGNVRGAGLRAMRCATSVPFMPGI
jgi:hypothetical protein